MAILCECGKLHYSLDHYFSVHGDYLDIREHRTQVEVFPDGRIADYSKIKDNQEIPPTTIKWVCKFCGNFNTTSNPASHKKGCEFITYLKFRETVPYKTTSPKTTPVYPTPKSPPKPTEIPQTTPEYVISEENLKTIANIRREIVNIIVSNSEIESGKRADWEERKERKSFEDWWENGVKEFLDIDTIKKVGSIRQFLYYLERWAELELPPSAYQLTKKRRILEWYLVSKLSWNHFRKLIELKKADGTAELDPTKKYELDKLLSLVPKPKKSLPKPENAPLTIQVESFIQFFDNLLIKHVSLSFPPFFPSGEIDRVGSQDKHWDKKIEDWKEYLRNSEDKQDKNGIFTDLETRKNVCKTIFAQVILDYLIEQKDKHGLESFLKTYTEPSEKAVYEKEPRKSQIVNIISGKREEPPTETGKFMYYHELFTPEERNVEELTIKEVDLDKFASNSKLKNYEIELREFPNLKRLILRESSFLILDISQTAPKLEEFLCVSKLLELGELILGNKPELKKLDIRQTLLTNLDLSTTKITPQIYDTPDFPIRMPIKGIVSKDYKDGKIVKPFRTTLTKEKIRFSEPWLKGGKDWRNASIDFRNNPQHIQEWLDNKFDFDQVKEWFGIGLKISDANFAKWLRDIKNYTPEEVLNNQDETKLREEFSPTPPAEEVDIWIEPTRIKVKERSETKGMMTQIFHDLTITVSQRGENRREGPHIIGNAWSAVGLINTYSENKDDKPGSLAGKKVQTIIIPNAGDSKKSWVGDSNRGSRNTKEEIRITGPFEKYDETTLTLTFKPDKVKLEGILNSMPL